MHGDGLPEVHLRAGCNIQQGATKFCRACLGVQPLPHHAHAVEGHASQQNAYQPARASNDVMIVTTTEGQVFSARLVDSGKQNQELDSDCSDAELLQLRWTSALSASAAMQPALGHVDIAACVVDEA